MSGRGFLISVDSIDSLCEYQEHAITPKSPRSPNAYGGRSDYFNKSHKGKLMFAIYITNQSLKS